MTLRQILLILRARYKAVIFTLLFVVTATLVISLLLPKQYTASTAVVVDVKSPDPLAGILPALATPSYMATQMDIIYSDRVAQRVVKLLRMDESASVKEQWMDDTEGKGDLVAWLANLLKKKLDLKPARDSNVINIDFTANDPAFATAVANAFAQAYIAINLELRVEPARQYATWFEDQTKTLRDELEQAKRALSAHQQEAGIVAIDERLDHEVTKLNDLSTQLTIVQAQTSDSSSKRKSSSNSETLPEVMQSPLVNSLKADIARLEAKLQESSVNLGRNHPQTQRAQSELASLRKKLAGEIRQISESIGTSYEVGKEKEKELREAMELQKKRVLELNGQRDQISVLQRDVEAAQRAFEGVSQRSTQTRLESLAAQTNIAILNPASMPTEASRPKILINLLVATFIGTLLGVAMALIREFRNRRVRSEEDLIEIIDLPVLATLSSSALPSRGIKLLPNRFSRHKSDRLLGTETS